MMGNFLTTLGNEPEADREMFEELGLNVARQPDNAANPRPDNRSGWMEGETPDVIEELISEPPAAALPIRLWDPSTQLRFKAKRGAPPRPEPGEGRPGRSGDRASDTVRAA
jgi:biotin synthase